MAYQLTRLNHYKLFRIQTIYSIIRPNEIIKTTKRFESDSIVSIRDVVEEIKKFDDYGNLIYEPIPHKSFFSLDFVNHIPIYFDPIFVILCMFPCWYYHRKFYYNEYFRDKYDHLMLYMKNASAATNLGYDSNHRATIASNDKYPGGDKVGKDYWKYFCLTSLPQVICTLIVICYMVIRKSGSYDGMSFLCFHDLSKRDSTYILPFIFALFITLKSLFQQNTRKAKIVCISISPLMLFFFSYIPQINIIYLCSINIIMSIIKYLYPFKAASFRSISKNMAIHRKFVNTTKKQQKLYDTAVKDNEILNLNNIGLHSYMPQNSRKYYTKYNKSIKTNP